MDTVTQAHSCRMRCDIVAIVLASASFASAQATQPSSILFKRFVIKDDTKFVGMSISRGIVPADWKVQGGLKWIPSSIYPGQFRIHFCDALDVSAMDLYPMRAFYWNFRQNAVAPGQVYMGEIVMQPPADQFEALEKIVLPTDRPDLKDAHVIDKVKMPEVAKAIFDRDSKLTRNVITVEVGKETFEYQFNGQTVDEVFNITLEGSTNRQLGFINWTISNVSSMRAVKGALDQVNQIRIVMSESIEPNQAWYDRVAQFVKAQEQGTLNKLQVEEARREAAENARTGANDAEDERFQKHMNDLDRQSDAQADIQREVSPWKDSDGDTYKLPTHYSNAWSAADGSIIMNNDPRYNPNSDPNLKPTQWTPMQQAGN